MLDDKYLRQIQEYSKEELKLYSDILSVKYYKQIEEACHDITNFGIDYISLGIFTAAQAPIFLSNMPNWSIPYNKEGLWKLDTINTSKTFYLLGTDHILQNSFKKSDSQEKLYEFCEAFNIYEVFSMLKSLGKVDINIIAHTRYPILDLNRFYVTHRQHVIDFACLLIARLQSILIEICPFLKGNPILWNQEILQQVLSSKLVYSPLTKKETEVLYQTSQGLTADKVAQELGVSIKSVNRALERARKKLDCTSTFQAVAKAHSLNIFQNIPTIDSIDNSLKFKYLVSERELEAIFWTSLGYSAKEIARFMQIEYKTVEKYLSTAQNKLECHNKVHLVYKAHYYGLLNEHFLRYISS
ncbi:MAG: hypothetical protein KIT27_00415 [Legionellales bacterium]|nr:hypothetical protein [Legionellales bacterium]